MSKAPVAHREIRKSSRKSGNGRPTASPAKAPRAESIWERRARFALPIALAMLLSLPMFSFSYLYDDFDFIGRALTFRLGDLLPDPGTLYWRPLSREGYFGLLALDPAQPLWGHLGNAFLLGVAVFLMASFVRKIAGPAAGLIAGVAFAALGAFPTLIGWVSCSQDVLAVVLVLAALHLQLEGRIVLAVGAMAMALLSKETSIAFVPGIVLLRWLLGRKPYRIRESLIGFGAVALAWAAVHPGIHVLIARRGNSAGNTLGSLTISGADRWGSMWRSLATLANLPVVAPSSTSWPPELTGVFVAAALFAGVGVWLLLREARRPGADPAPLRIASLGVLLTIPAILLISMLVKRWQPYYLILASIGSTLLLGYLGAKLPRPAAVLLVVGFIALGIWYRGTDLGSSIPTERNMRQPSEHLKVVQAAFGKLYPTLTGPAQVFISTQTPETFDVLFHLLRFEVLRAWYRNPAIQTLHPERRRPHPPSEQLIAITPDLHVHRIDTNTLRVQSSGGSLDPVGYGTALRAYAQGLAASGETARGVQLLTSGLKESDPWYAAYDRRLAAALLIADGRHGEAEAILRDTPAFNPEDAVAASSLLLLNPPRRNIDTPVLIAMGVPPNDPETMRGMMRWFAMNKYPDATIRFARRVLAVKPGDPEAEAVIRMLQPGSKWEQVTEPVEHDVVW